MEREEAFLEAVGRSRNLHRPWVSPPASFRDYRAYLESLGERNIGYFVTTAEGELAGVVNINEIVRGYFQSGCLGYYALEPHAGKGVMTAGVRRVVSLCFREHRLHRLEANIQPRNTASKALVRSLGFVCEGLSPRYLKIGGRWRDHERWAVTKESWAVSHDRPQET